MGLISSGAFVTQYFASGQILSGHLGNFSVNSGNISSGNVSPYHLTSGTLQGQTSIGGIAVGALQALNQTASYSGLLFQLPATGLYAVKSYAEILQGGLLNVGTLSVGLNFQSESQIQVLTAFTGVALVTSGAFSQACNYIRGLSGTNVFSTVTLTSLTGTPHYNFFSTIERIA